MIFFENHIKSHNEKLINGADIYGLHFNGDGATIKDTPLFNILDEGVYLPLSVQNSMDCKGHIKGGHKQDAKLVGETFFDPMNELDI